MERISKWRSESLKFYKYLCQKIGSEKVVKTRRLAYTIRDMGHGQKMISSGSIGEGLNLNGSDFDYMFIDPNFKVYQSESEVQSQCSKNPLITDNEESHPCFTQLRPIDPNTMTVPFNYFQMNYRGNAVFSSELFKLHYKNTAISHIPDLCFGKIHGPCISNQDETIDVAWSLKCDKWINQAKPWISRPRTTWPSSEIISEIVSSGVLFVAIGNKGSINEHVEWRISFSVAEKFLIFSFSHTQFLCYAMLKIVLKEIVEKHEDLKGLLCSYFLKMIIFWISEETETHLWRPDNVIPCFMACIQRLSYCVKYSILSHYFIPDNNLFFLRFSTAIKDKLTNILKDVYKQGINCFASSETLRDYQSQSYDINQSIISGNITFLQQMIPQLGLIRGFDAICTYPMLVYNFLHHSRTSLSRSLFALQISETFMHFTQRTQYPHRSGNKHHYNRYEHDLSHLVIGLHSDAVSGLLKLASFLYVHNNYVASLTVITYTLQKYTDEKIYPTDFRTQKKTFSNIQKHVLNLMKTENLNTILKSVTIHPFVFTNNSPTIPQELQLDVTRTPTSFHPLKFAHFLHFLCYYHLHDLSSCEQSVLRLEQLILSDGFVYMSVPDTLNTLILCGIADQLMSDTETAKLCFQVAAKFDMDNETSAASRLASRI
ncbi:Hypothetical predicted protein [Mytilus galloprovincialis]|uniref:Mab-21-like HhH/H2TH-like domain-containing protein n=1 Tax=Mytilus galloprovincialis TaxID=29158 RepID=A0A8B6C0I2_MYTGA|nr:Hypothetical predicted protein [Mytilus galloprovincialis]